MIKVSDKVFKSGNSILKKDGQGICMHCEKEKSIYCENCYQELITENAELQQKCTWFKNLCNKNYDTAMSMKQNYISKQVIKELLNRQGNDPHYTLPDFFKDIKKLVESE